MLSLLVGILQMAKYVLYIVTALAGLIKFITHYTEFRQRDYPGSWLFERDYTGLNMLIALFSDFTPAEIEQAKTPSTAHFMKFSNRCGYVFYIGTLVSLFVFCFTYNL